MFLSYAQAPFDLFAKYPGNEHFFCLMMIDYKAVTWDSNSLRSHDNAAGFRPARQMTDPAAD